MRDIDSMTDKEVESMTDKEIEDFLADDAAKVGDGVAVRTPRELVWVMFITACIGMVAAANLILAQINMSVDPNNALSCDINSLVGCSDFLRSDVNALFFNVPNALFGIMFFAGILGISVALASGAELSRWLWRMLCAGMIGAAAWLVWFQITAVFVERLLCPYCIVTWVVTIPLVIHVLIRSVSQGHLPGGQELGNALVALRWWLVVLTYAAVTLVVVIGLWDKLTLVF